MVRGWAGLQTREDCTDAVARAGGLVADGLEVVHEARASVELEELLEGCGDGRGRGAEEVYNLPLVIDRPAWRQYQCAPRTGAEAIGTPASRTPSPSRGAHDPH